MADISEMLGRGKTWYKNNLWQGRLLLSVSVILLVLVIVRISLPYTIVFSAVYWLDKQGVTSQIEDISINVIKGTFSVHNATGSKDGERVFNIGKASIDWEWAPLSTKTIVVKQVALDDFDLDAQQYSDGIIIAGITISNDGSVEQQPAQEDQPVSWSTALNQVDFSDLNFCYQQHDAPLGDSTTENAVIDYCATAGHFTWEGDISLVAPAENDANKTPRLVVSGALKLSKLSLLNNVLDASLINLDEVTLSDIQIDGMDDVKLDAISISKLQLLQGTGHALHQHAVELDQIDITDIGYSNNNTLAIKAISLDTPRLSMAKEASGAWKYEQWLPQSANTDDKNSQPPSQPSNDNSVFNFNIGSILITGTELCYQQPALTSGTLPQAIDYCLGIASTRWNGDISFSTPTANNPLELKLAGDLVVADFITTNNLLQRDLLDFDELSINKIDVNALDNLAFGKLSLANVNGLELTSAEDKYTLSVSSLDISTFKYANNTLAIDKVAVNEPGLEITQNKDGTFDFEEWKIETTEAPKENSKTTDTATTTEPLKMKLGEFSLDTTRVIEFTDLSVEPVMHIGFKEMHVSVKDLDSEKPDQKSPIALSAKTTRHGTIDIAGVAKPFEPNPSFDASGKISGLDLRAASPKAEQAIGHIIKSGQLDADLKLFAEEGQLDSNLGLTLYHFNLKAKSKEDAAALDDVFGMPINQSLMLLKDKKGTIKLDIPITGDVNNPDFDPTDAIIKATTKATTVTLITFYTPYGLAYAGGNVLFNLATAMNFEPLLFDAGSSQLTDSGKEQLDKLAELLTERPAVYLTLCGFTNLSDRDKLFTEILDKEKIKPPTAERLTQLKKLGAERQDTVKNYLISAGKIEHSRLILCEPEHSDDADAIAGVEISI
jgi:outer membrane protein OmpA-like peptidoglycan-associated protein